MNFFNSIRWRLQIWYGLILVLVLVGFGFSAHQLERGRIFRRVDDELHRRLNMLVNAARQPPRGRRPFLDNNDVPPRRPVEEEVPEDFREMHQAPLPEKPPREFHLPTRAANLFDEADTNGFYYVVKLRDGTELRSSNAPPSVEIPPSAANRLRENFNNLPGEDADLSQNPREPQPPIERGEYREIMAFTPGEVVLVGRSVAPELHDFRFAALKLFAIGSGILLLGLAGGWWLASRAIRPIEDISAAAAKISAGDLSQRINTAETESELGKLAAVLNSTFARLETSFAQQQQFTSDAAHELRTPVSVMLTQTQTTLNRERSADEYRETLEACRRSAQRMRRLIESLLELARLDAGQEQLKRRKFDLAATARDCLELIQPLADERGVKVFSELAPQEIAGDSERLAQVITNLFTNAIQYNRIGGEVWVNLKKEHGVAILTISDKGVGIASEDLPHIFERFYRGDKSRSAGNGHAGLGLAICQAIIAAHGGIIEVSSKEGSGTTFTVRLPVEA